MVLQILTIFTTFLQVVPDNVEQCDKVLWSNIRKSIWTQTVT